MDGSSKLKTPAGNFRQFFFRGLAILLPSVLTIWLLLAAYQFVQGRIAEPINRGVRELVVQTTPWPLVRPTDIEDHYAGEVLPNRDARQAYNAAESRGRGQAWLERDARRTKLRSWWDSWAFPMDLIGLAIAIVLIYMAGLLLGSYIGHRLYARGEAFVNQLPLVGRVYPSVKQVTDFFVGQSREKVTFNRVVAVQYPRKGLWSVGLVTGDTMSDIQDVAGEDCMTVFVPSSPTPFTGYVITIPKCETVELPITVEDAMKFAVSGGVLIPPNQQIPRLADASFKQPGASSAEPGGGPGDGDPDRPDRREPESSPSGRGT